MFGTAEKGVKQGGAKGDQLNGLLDKGCSFDGKLTFDGTVQINGDFKGEILSDGTLVVGNDANVSAKIMVDTLVAYGRINGEIEAKNRVELHLPAVVVAGIKTKSLSIEDGVVFEGRCHMEQRGVAQAEIESGVGENMELIPENAEAEESVLM
jgi:cytoskeletal protein CcmA (bactofilin family)